MPSKINFIDFQKVRQLGAGGLGQVGTYFCDLWHHMKPWEPSPCDGMALKKKMPEELHKPAVLPPEYKVNFGQTYHHFSSYNVFLTEVGRYV